MTWTNVEAIAADRAANPKEIRQVLTYLKRRAKARFYADENFPIRAVDLLREMGAEVLTAQQVGLCGHPDENQISFALRNKLVFVTCDRDFLDEKRFPLIHCPAIFVFDFGSGSSGEIMQAFRCLHSVFRTPQFYDKWWKIDARRRDWNERVRYLDGTTSRGRFRIHSGRLQQWT